MFLGIESFHSIRIRIQFIYCLSKEMRIIMRIRRSLLLMVVVAVYFVVAGCDFAEKKMWTI